MVMKPTAVNMVDNVVVHVGEIRNAYKIVVGKPEGK
jgi:hypothetical protein